MPVVVHDLAFQRGQVIHDLGIPVRLSEPFAPAAYYLHHLWEHRLPLAGCSHRRLELLHAVD